MTLGVLFGLVLRGGLRWGREVIFFVFLASPAKTKIRDFLRFGVDFGRFLEVQIGENFDLGEFVAMLFFSCCFSLIFGCFLKVVDLEFVAPVEAKH